jgi:hypothetical protein
MKILYNDSYGAFAFSAAFLAAYKERTGVNINLDNALFRLGPDSIRCDPVAIALIEEHGVEWASGPNAWLAIREIPDLFAQYWEIDEYDGNESVRVRVSDALADVLDTYMETRDHAVLERQYSAIAEGRKVLAETSPYGLQSQDMEPTSTTPPQLTVSDVV